MTPAVARLHRVTLHSKRIVTDVGLAALCLLRFKRFAIAKAPIPHEPTVGSSTKLVLSCGSEDKEKVVEKT